MIIETGRFGRLSVDDDEIIQVPNGILGFPNDQKFCLVDPGDETLILWLQSLVTPALAFPVLEPKVFKANYSARLSAAELRELKLETINQSAVFAILTIPEDVTKMTANLKAPVVINLKDHLAKQVVLQENEYPIRFEMFKELKAHLITIASQRMESQKGIQGESSEKVSGAPRKRDGSAVSLRDIPPSLTARSLEI